MYTEETGKDFNKCYVLNGILQHPCIDMENVHGIVDESRHSSWARFPKNYEIYKNTGFENIEKVFNIT